MARRGWAASLALATGLLIAGCGLPPSEPDGGLPFDELDFERVPVDLGADDGPGVGAVEIARGSVGGGPFTLAVYPGPPGVCYALQAVSGGGSGCGGLPGGELGATFGMIGSGSGTGTPGQVYGVVAAGVARVNVELRGRPPARALLLSLGPIGLDDRFFASFLPEGSVAVAAVALGADGSVIERFDLTGPP